MAKRKQRRRQLGQINKIKLIEVGWVETDVAIENVRLTITDVEATTILNEASSLDEFLLKI